MLENIYNAKEIAFMATQYDDYSHSADGAILHALCDEVYSNLSDDDILFIIF